MVTYIQRIGQQLSLTIDGVRYLAVPTGNTDIWLLNAAEAGPGPGEPPDPVTGSTHTWPFNPNTQVSSEYGPRDGRVHQGIDFGAGLGTDIHASSGGVCYAAYYHSGFGNHIIIDHGVTGGVQLYTLYAHMLNPANFSEGQAINKGDVVGLVNNTGSSFGSHLHWETHINAPGFGPTWTNPGTHLNPRTFMATYGDPI